MVEWKKRTGPRPVFFGEADGDPEIDNRNG